jgi:hypothetical protein
MTGYLPYDAHLARLQELRTRAATHRRVHRDEAALTESPESGRRTPLLLSKRAGAALTVICQMPWRGG